MGLRDNYLKRVGDWLNGEGPNSAIVLSSRIRLARNLKNLPFSPWANNEYLKIIADEVAKEALGTSFFKKELADIIEIGALSSLDKQFLLERHLISNEMVTGRDGLLITEHKEMLSVMVNEEDHLRIQILSSGLSLLSCWQVINQADNELSQNLDYALSLELGYLTACPTNVGTGMRASVMLHLPALTLSNQINQVLKAASQLGLAIRGIHGEGTEAIGNLFQISNQVTLGRSEEEIVDSIERVTNQIIGYEKNAYKILLKQKGPAIEDKIFRAYGILKNARILSSKEAINLLSLLRLGISMGFLKEISLARLNELLIINQPAHIQKIRGRQLKEEERNIARASIIRQKLLTVPNEKNGGAK